MRPPTGAELAGVLGTVQTVEVVPSAGARSFEVSPGGGGPLADFVEGGRLQITVALLGEGCPEGRRRLTVGWGGGRHPACLNPGQACGSTPVSRPGRDPLPLEPWVPLYAVRPGGRSTDPDPPHRTLVRVDFSRHPDIERERLPDHASAAELPP